MNFDLTSAASSISALQALAGDSAEARQNITALSEMVADADYTIKQLTRALREEIEPPTFMGEPLVSPRTRAIGSWLKAQSNLSRHWKTHGPTVEPQWCGDANKLLETARELFLQAPGWCDVCDERRTAPCDFPECTHGVQPSDEDRLLGFLEASKFHKDASHVPPDYRDGYNHALSMVIDRIRIEQQLRGNAGVSETAHQPEQQGNGGTNP